MAKKAKKTTKKKAAPKDPRIQETYETTVTFNCPKRGKVTQVVKVRRFKPLSDQVQKHVVGSSDSLDTLNDKDDGLAIYSDEET